MGGRYLVTGTQLGMIKGLRKDPKGIESVVDDILASQSVFGSTKSIDQDVRMVHQMVMDAREEELERLDREEEEGE